ncbi:inositol monophosphatase family protein [Pseudomarimonas salicorniae]|uniref:Inositol-phosphate phosphatase n=1 Tax=Pseudomarimonas salicorniae TaxID=2933270 RepID=A0ABT0GFH7_9GAMM|nr:inositol monophosphatase family protein [Lysobacter sp. CAU 1642]MCK7592785.1 inositol-phosphate phosphatase [Lysobacter sp. CAU 1642]
MNLDDAFLDHALQVARQAVDAAAQVIHGHYRSETLGVEHKADDSPVTRADVESEQAIRRVLLGAFPDHAIYGEEEGRRGDSPFLWLVDPIDGTKSFVRSYPMFSTQVALMVGDELVLGVSCASEFGETAWARRGGGAFLDGRPVRCATTEGWNRATLSTGNLKSLATGRGWRQLGELVPKLHRIRGYGDFFHYHLLARGSIDLVLESDVNILDIAALTVIVREAGGVFTDLDGQPPGLATTSVLAGVPDLHARGLDHFRNWRA